MNPQSLPAPILSRLNQKQISKHADDSLVFDIREYFSGRVEGAGVIIDMSGIASLRFIAVIHGIWHGDHGVLKEEFTYGDSSKLLREWQIDFIGDHDFIVQAADVPGGGRGRQIGNSAVMNYRLEIPRRKKLIAFSMEDWMHLNEDGTLINRTRISKFGLKVGQLVASFRRVDAG